MGPAGQLWGPHVIPVLTSLFFSVVSSSPCSPTWLTQPLHRSSRLGWSPAFVPRHASRRHTPLRCAVRRCMPSRRSVHLLPRKKPAAAATSYQLAPPLLPIQFSHAAIKPSSSLLSSLSIDLLLHCRLPLFHKSNPHKIRRQQEPPCELPSAWAPIRAPAHYTLGHRCEPSARALGSSCACGPIASS